MSWARPMPSDWKRRRRRILERDQHRCVLCGEQATEVDHIGHRDNHEPENLRALCGPCHRERTLQQAAAAAEARRQRLQLPAERHPGLRGGG